MPAATVFLALASAAGTQVRQQVNAADRETFKQATANQTFDLLRRCFLGLL
jgi:nicotinamide mononucleotide (NMN) deamidase PncC